MDKTQIGKGWCIAGILMAGLLLTGCGGGGSSSTAASSALVTTGTRIAQPGWNIDFPTSVQPQKKWTVLVYMNAANDLEEFGTLNANQLEQVGSTRDVNFVVQFKRVKGYYDASDGDWGGTRRYYITRDYDTSHVGSTILSDMSTLDMGDPQTLQDFVQWGIATFPAQRYCLVMWNHGAGWRSQTLPGTKGRATTAAAVPGRGVSYDDEYGTHIDTIQIPSAMDIGSGRKWDLLVWDASLMQMAEVVYQLRNEATYIAGSEESPPGTGYPYDQIASALTAAPDSDGKTLGIVFAQKMLAANGTSSDVTQSVLDPSKIAAVVSALDSLGSALYAVRSTYGQEIADARAASENYKYPENRDLLDFVKKLSTADSATGKTVTSDSTVSAAVSQVQTALSAAVLFNTHGSGHPRSNGLGIYLPTPSVYQQIDIEQANGFGQRYSALAMAQDAPHWQTFLSSALQ